MPSIFQKKPLSVLLQEANDEKRLRRVLGPWSLTALGIGCIIGAGIFVVTGMVARDITGPALIASFLVAGLACVFAAMCYAEFASLAPVAGSAYTYAYASLGEIWAWIIGWDLVLEYSVAAASVANAWSGHVHDLMAIAGLKIPHVLMNTPFAVDPSNGHLVSTGCWLDILALGITLALSVILVLGIRESARFNGLMVLIKVAVVLFVIIAGIPYINPENWKPFAPYGWGGISIFGKLVWGQVAAHGSPVGMMAGAAVLFFAFIGFDSVSTHAEEARNPQRDVPIGIITSLVVATLLYVGVAAVLTGIVPHDQIPEKAAIAAIFASKGLPWARVLVDIGAVVGITSVLMVLLLSQPRVLFAMARDGLLPQGFFGAVHSKFRTPYKSTILTAIVVGIMSSVVPLKILSELVNIGTLLAFVIVCVSIPVMRYTHPEAKRAFRVPGSPVIPILGVLTCLVLMLSLQAGNWYRLIIWLVIGMVIYFSYGRKHSHMNKASVPVDD
ncbi:MAG: amino acid permease [Armatimonadota bacterium]